jgi:hypothetical protein
MGRERGNQRGFGDEAPGKKNSKKSQEKFRNFNVKLYNTFPFFNKSYIFFFLYPSNRFRSLRVSGKICCIDDQYIRLIISLASRRGTPVIATITELKGTVS